ncbi:MAG TPA: 50S ribosomal protein L32 [candidate division Zixibacteria bacterium]|nr:50S ribosomal protein L32 [candidate division Zixibacteria bacterium]HBZ01852.1 50S ribosomal protein L32 [candidate division Zixibacteria bacterium]
MPLPKRRHSKTRGAKRRTHWKLSKPNLVECPHCHEPRLSHQICPHCGWYKGREVVAITETK